jgi:tRNA (guanine26-N2/guanine27-N2)-dimethyltransferase
MSTRTKEHVPEGYCEIIEGQASMLYDNKEAVFYNKVQVLNRDLSCQVIRLFAEHLSRETEEKISKKQARAEALAAEKGDATVRPTRLAPFDGLRVLDALAATGLRSVRYLKEVPGVKHVTINDLLPEATAQAQRNCERNSVDPGSYTIHTGDAVSLMHVHKDAAVEDPSRRPFDVIDLDPYGTAVPFLDAAVQAVADGGLLAVTCTDSPVLCGSYPETCYAKYGSVPLKNKYVHEQVFLGISSSLLRGFPFPVKSL